MRRLGLALPVPDHSTLSRRAAMLEVPRPPQRQGSGGEPRALYGRRSKAEAAFGRWKRVIGGGLRSRKDERRATEVAVAARALNHMLELGRPTYVRIVRTKAGLGSVHLHP